MKLQTYTFFLKKNIIVDKKITMMSSRKKNTLFFGMLDYKNYPK